MVAATSGSLSQLGVMVIFNYPADDGRLSQLGAMVVAESSPILRASQLGAMVVYRGRIDNNTVRCWTFSLDGHDFYVIALGSASTLVYDLTTQQWSEWSSPDLATWRAHKGQNWVTMGETTWTNSTTNVVAGDDNFGLLWTLDPTVGYDESPRDAEPTPFDREVTGGVPGKLRDKTRVNAVYLTGSMAKPQVLGSGITLETSDDNGTTWQDHGTVTVDANNFDQEFSWRSLGLIKSPGKLFRITDSGASVRIDSLDMR